MNDSDPAEIKVFTLREDALGFKARTSFYVLEGEDTVAVVNVIARLDFERLQLVAGDRLFLAPESANRRPRLHAVR